MSTTLEPRPLADLEEDALIRVEEKWGRRARGAKPWTTAEYLNEIAKVHARFAALRLSRREQAA